MASVIVSSSRTCLLRFPPHFALLDVCNCEFQSSKQNSCWGAHHHLPRQLRTTRKLTVAFGRRNYLAEEEEEAEEGSSPLSSSKFREAVEQFNATEFFVCHDILEALWYSADDPIRVLLHAILQCAVGFHHLFNQNHRGAMMELGEGLCKLRKLRFEEGPFYQFEREISDVLNFIYQTQLELAACTEDICIGMDQTERSYQLLGNFAAKQEIYFVETDDDTVQHIVFHPERSYGGAIPPCKIRLPKLNATEEDLRCLG